MVNDKVFIVRYGEVALKGGNRPYFERLLIERVKKLIKPLGSFEVKRHEGLVLVYPDGKFDSEKVIKEVSKVFGVSTISPAIEIESDLDIISQKSVEYIRSHIDSKGVKTFKIETHRADKSFPLKSPEISAEIGAVVLKNCSDIKVDVHNPDMILHVNLRKNMSFLYDEKISGFGGLPLGTNGKGLVLLSGGIDSPVAAFMMAKRGMKIEAVHFHSYPYTSDRAMEKVEELAKVLSIYCGNFKMHTINLLPIQESIAMNCPEEEMVIQMRRFMMRIAERIAEKESAGMLITGESLGQVASQTAESIIVTDASVDIPVMRPLIALDKVDIMKKAEEIGTYEISIQPFEDCCTVFLPKHPLTKPKLDKILESENKLEVEKLIEEAISFKEKIFIES